MSLGYIFVCADDGEIYQTDYIKCDGYDISFEEYAADELWLYLPPGGIPKARLKTGEDAMALVRRDGLPIVRLRFDHVGQLACTKHGAAFYAIVWEKGKAFPRRMLPAHLKPVMKPHEGTYCCYTKQHRDKIRKVSDK